jgi:hypothetical protein
VFAGGGLLLPTKLIGRRTPTDKASPDRNQPLTDVHPMERLHIGASRPPAAPRQDRSGRARSLRRRAAAHLSGSKPRATLEHFPIRRNRKVLCKSLICRVFEPENRLAWLCCTLFLKTL